MQSLFPQHVPTVAQPAPAEPPSRPPGPYAGVAIEQSVDRILDYAIPAKLRPTLQVGQRVRVPLGRNNRPTHGYVISIRPETTYPKIKSLLDIDDERVLFTPGLMELALWMSRYYCTPLGTVLESVIPSAVKRKVGMGYLHMVRLAEDRAQTQALLEQTKAAKRRAILARLLLLDPGQGIELVRLAGEAGVAAATVRKLVRLGLITITPEPDLPQLTADVRPSSAAEQDIQLNQEQQKVFDDLVPRITAGGFSVNLLYGVTGSGKTEVYLQCIRKVVEAGKQAIVLVPEIALTPQTVRRFTVRFPHVAILHSGLTATERHRFWQMIWQGQSQVVVGARSAIFAPVPNLGMIVVDEEHEASYKQDTAPRYHGRDIAIKRAQLENVPILLGSATPSLETYWRVTRASPAVSRPSAIPSSTGVPPVSEAQDVGDVGPTDSTRTPHGRDGRATGEPLAPPTSGMGASPMRPPPSPGTPGEGRGEGQSQIQNPKSKMEDSPTQNSAPDGAPKSPSPYHLLTLPHRVRGIQMPAVELVDMKVANRFRHGVHLLSERLEHLLRTTLEAGHQAILLLNRRGYANFVYCPACTNVVQCKYCDATMTYHRSAATGVHSAALDQGLHTGQLHCHYCLAVNPLPDKCPECGKKLSLFGLGTQRVEEEIQKKFPTLKFARVDSDTMRSSKDYEALLGRFAQREIQVMLGTQMIAKGLDYPNVTLVGVISGDTALALPDFRAAERTFQLITQVAGRAGRGQSPGRVVLQTFLPDDPTIQAAIKQDFARFAKTELANRQHTALPPFSRMVRIILRDQDQQKLHKLSEELASHLAVQVAKDPDSIRVRGPMPCPISRIAGHYRNQIVLVSPRAEKLQRILAALREAHHLSKPDRIAVDVDPVSLL